jgi:hypothetical protein
LVNGVACCNTHDSCPNQTALPLPTRVVEVGSETSEPHLVLSEGRRGRWAALSHRWGQGLSLKTEVKNLAQHCEELPLNKLPQTFKDAILVTRGLGLQYLWIDALCVIQDSLSDWLVESSHMNYVYKDAAITIAAEAAASSSAGILTSITRRSGGSRQAVKAKCHSERHAIEGSIFFHTAGLVDPIRGPLSDRAWALQEDVLSPRVLRFTEEELTWRCPGGRRRERFPSENGHLWSEKPRSYNEIVKLGSSTPLNSYIQQDTSNLTRERIILEYWYLDIVDEYISRDISYQKDRLVAIAGIAKEIQKHWPGILYQAGLWLHDFHRALLWFPATSGSRRHEEYTAPSWSWGSMDFSYCASHSGKRIHGNIPGRIEPIGKILEVTVIGSRVQDPFGPVEAGGLMIEAPCQSVCSCRAPLSFFDERVDSGDADFGNWEVAANKLDAKLEGLRVDRVGVQPCSKDYTLKHKPLLYIQIARWNSESVYAPRDIIMGLILEESNDSDQKLYRRAGRALILDDPEPYIEWPTRIVKIL